jgi:hypothetical protein
MRLRLTRQRGPLLNGSVLIVIGAGVCTLAVWALVDTLTPKQVPVQPPFGVGIVGPAAAKPSRGLLVRLDVQVHSCGEPVEARLTIAPSSEFWIDHGDALRGRVSDIAAAIGDGHLIKPTVVPGAGETPAGQGGPQPRVVSTSVSTTGTSTVIRARLARWAETRGAVSVLFKARWLSPRTSTLFLFRTCYLRVPQLVGPVSLETAYTAATSRERQLGEAFAVATKGGRGLYLLGDNTSVASTLVHAPELDLNLALPGPTSHTSEGTQWSCVSTPVSLSARPGEGDISVVAGQVTASVSAVARSLRDAEQTCGTSVVVREGGVTAALPAFMLLVGIVFAYGGVDVIVLGLRALFERRPKRQTDERDTV